MKIFLRLFLTLIAIIIAFLWSGMPRMSPFSYCGLKACPNDYGWPLIYRHFGGGFGESQIFYLNLIIDILFWFVTIYLVWFLAGKMFRKSK